MTTENPQDPQVIDSRIASMVNTMIQVSDPRLVAVALLGNAAALFQFAAKHGKMSPQQIALQFSQALVEALEPQTEEKESRIVVANADYTTRN